MPEQSDLWILQLGWGVTVIVDRMIEDTVGQGMALDHTGTRGPLI